MAALDDKVLDPVTRRPRKVLVCKDHVPMPKSALTHDSLSMKHSANAPKPSIPGLHRSMMGERGLEYQDGEEPIGYHYDRVQSPRSLNQGSHADLLRASQQLGKDNSEEEKVSTAPTATTTTTLPKFQQGRFTVSTTGEESQGPVRHSDYEQQQPEQQSRPSNISRQESDQDSWYDGSEDNKQDRIFTTKGGMGGGESTVDMEKKVVNSLGNLALGSKLMEHKHRHEDEDEHQEVEEDDWDTAPREDLGRREIIAGM